MYASMNTSYKGSATHNDLTSENLPEHIDREKSKDNLYVVFDVEINENSLKNISVRQIEKPTRQAGFYFHEEGFYVKNFSTAMDAQREKNIREGHQKRNENVNYSKWYNETYPPEEQVLQIGDMDTPKDLLPSSEELIKMTGELSEWERTKLNTENGIFVPLDAATHMGEATPHVHRRNMYAVVEDGVLKPGNAKKVFELAGIEPPMPDPDFSMISDEKERKKALREFEKYNNRKVTFDRMRREKWQNICLEHGFEIELETKDPAPDIQDIYDQFVRKYTTEPDLKIQRHSRQKDIHTLKAERERKSKLKEMELDQREENLSTKEINFDKKVEEQTQKTEKMQEAERAAKENYDHLMQVTNNILDENDKRSEDLEAWAYSLDERDSEVVGNENRVRHILQIGSKIRETVSRITGKQYDEGTDLEIVFSDFNQKIQEVQTDEQSVWQREQELAKEALRIKDGAGKIVVSVNELNDIAASLDQYKVMKRLGEIQYEAHNIRTHASKTAEVMRKGEAVLDAEKRQKQGENSGYGL